MIKQNKKLLTIITFILLTAMIPFQLASATSEVMWGKIHLKQGMIGKVIILKDTIQYTKQGSKLKSIGRVKKGQEIGVYTNSNNLFGFGGGKFLKNDNTVSFRTPSAVMWGKANKDVSVRRGTKWNMSIKDVKAIEGIKPIDEGIINSSQTGLVYASKKYGYNCSILYTFNRNKLSQIYYSFRDFEYTYQTEDGFNYIKRQLTKELGSQTRGYLTFSSWSKGDLGVNLITSDNEYDPYISIFVRP